MNWHTISLPAIVIGVLMYHLSQKNIPKDANPLFAIAAAYIVALMFCLAVLLTTGEIKKGSELARNQSWLPIVFLGLSAIVVEVGYLYAYRTGWKISTTSITTGPFITVSLAVIGTIWFKEHLTPVNIVGIVLCVIGVVCINMK